MEITYVTDSKTIALAACLLISASVSIAFSQWDDAHRTASMATVRGRVTVPDGSRLDSLYVEVGERGRSLERVAVAYDGSFELRDLSRDSHVIRVVNSVGEVLLTEFLNTAAYVSNVELRVPGVARARPTSGTVSVQALKPLPHKVRDDLRRAQRASEAGNYQQATDHLERAVLACPACMVVHNSLGAIYMRSGEIERSAAEFRRAVELDPNSAMAQNNLAISLVALKDYEGAQTAARSALRLDPASIPARYALGLVSLGRNECTAEAVAHLRVAASAFPRAFLSAAQMRVCQGDIVGAMEEVEAYLGQPKAPERKQAEAWLVTLRAQVK